MTDFWKICSYFIGFFRRITFLWQIQSQWILHFHEFFQPIKENTKNKQGFAIAKNVGEKSDSQFGDFVVGSCDQEILCCKNTVKSTHFFPKISILFYTFLDGSHSFDKLGRSRSQSMSRTSSGSGESPFYEDYAEIVDDPESADYSSPSRDFELNR